MAAAAAAAVVRCTLKSRRSSLSKHWTPATRCSTRKSNAAAAALVRAAAARSGSGSACRSISSGGGEVHAQEQAKLIEQALDPSYMRQHA
jgi:hypothetical protein